MEILKSICFGLVCGLSEFFPISASAHRSLFCLVSGMSPSTGLRLFTHCGCLAAVLLQYAAQLKHIRREMRIAGATKRRRMRQPDRRAVAQARTVLTACVPMALAFLLLGKTTTLSPPLWLTAVLLFANGAIVYLPQFLPQGELDGREMAPLDGVLYGLCSTTAFLPGISRIAVLLLAGQLRGSRRENMSELVFLLSIPWLIGMIVLDLIAWITVGISGGLLFWLGALLAAAAAFGAACGAIAVMRFLTVRIGFHGFSFYCWGIGFACMIFYLII